MAMRVLRVDVAAPRPRGRRAAWFAAALSAVLVLPAAAQDPSPAPTAADLFNDQVVHELRLFMYSGDWELLQARFMENTYYPADVHWNGVTVRNVGVRSRGSGSRDPRKPGLKIDFNEYVSGQTLVGLKSIALDNFRQDPGMIKELVSMQLFRKMGQVAPRVSHARVYVNNEYIGLFAILEPVDKTFLKTWLGDNTGYLFEFNWSNNWYFEWLGADLDPYVAMFEAKTRDDEPPEQIYRPLEAMVEAANHTSLRTWDTVMQDYLDLEVLLRYVAVETFLSDHDGFAGDWGLNNFYVYRFAENGRSVLLPWDKDVNFREISRDIFDGFDQNVLLSTALLVPRLRQAYLEALRQCATLAAEPLPEGDGAGWMEREIAREIAMIRASAYEDPRKAYTNERFEQEAEWMMTFARQRSGDVLRQLDRERDRDRDRDRTGPAAQP
jgi:hypothetical protein